VACDPAFLRQLLFARFSRCSRHVGIVTWVRIGSHGLASMSISRRYTPTAHRSTDRANMHTCAYESTPCVIGMCSGTELPTTTRCLHRRGRCALDRPREPWSMRLPPWRPLGVQTATLGCVNGFRWCHRGDSRDLVLALMAVIKDHRMGCTAHDAGIACLPSCVRLVSPQA
jgi:hypothetical protein